MYPYFIYNAEYNDMVYNNDGTKENMLFISLDKKIKDVPLTNRIRLIDLLHDMYKCDSVECADIVNTIINNCTMEGKYHHIQVIAEYMQLTINTFNYF